MKETTIVKTGIIFFLVGVFSTQLSSLLCWLWLDDLSCYLQIVCDAWDRFEYLIAHKAFSIGLYYLGLYGFVGSILYYIEVKYLEKYISKFINIASGVFGWFVTTIICTFIMNWLANFLYLTDLFEIIYKFCN